MGDKLLGEIAQWGEATFHDPAPPAVIAEVEASLGHPLPLALRDLLAQTDGIDGEYDLGLIWAAARIAADNALFRTDPNFRELYMPFDGLVFFADGGNGDQFFVSLRGNQEVFVWNHESDERTWIAASVRGYLEGWMSGRLTI